MPPGRLPAAGYRARPWRNGRGTSFEIAAAGAIETPGYAISETSIQVDGPFSDYTGYDRTIVLIAGAGFDLVFDDGEIARIEPSRPSFSFDGGRPLTCRLIDGPVHAFNAITARAAFVHDLDLRERIDAPIAAGSDELLFIHGVDTIRLPGPGAVDAAFVGAGAQRIVRIRPTAKP